MTLPFLTVGHSNRSLETFLKLLRAADVGFVADIRRLPGSRAQPQFDAGPLADALAAAQVGYGHIAELGGRRGRTAGAEPGLNDGWRNSSFRNYADYALTAPFQAGLAVLVAEGRRRRVAMMCAEAVWWRCHRRIVTDHLLARGETVLHIMGEGRLEPARLTPGAVARADGTVVYPEASPSPPPATPGSHA